MEEIQYKDYRYFGNQEAEKWICDLVKFTLDVKHKNYILFSEYVQIVEAYKSFLASRDIKLISSHPLLDTKNINFPQFIESTWGAEPNLCDMSGDTAYYIPQLLEAKKPKEFGFWFFKNLEDKSNVTIQLPEFRLVKLLAYDVEEIKKVYAGELYIPNSPKKKFYLTTEDVGDTLNYVHDFVNTKVIPNTPGTILWDVEDVGSNTCVALVYLNVDKSKGVANMDVILSNEYTNTDIYKVFKLIKSICFDKLKLSKIYAVNYNMSFAYSTLNSVYYFAGFKPAYEIDHATFEANPDPIPSIDELYTANQSVINNIVVDI